MLVQQRAAHAYDFLQNEVPGVGKRGTQTHSGKGRKSQANFTWPDLNTVVKNKWEGKAAGLPRPRIQER